MFAVLDGAPNGGKSTMINMLDSLGYPVMPEIAEIVIKEGFHKPWLGDAEQLAFQEEVFARQQMAELALSAINKMVFLDRGTVAAIAYRLIHGRALTDLHHRMTASHYNMAFILEPLDTWDDNGVRYEDLTFAREMTSVMKRVYDSFGVPCFLVPKGSRESRLNFVLNTAQAFPAPRPFLREAPLKARIAA